MKASKQLTSFAVSVGILAAALVFSPRLFAQTAPTQSSTIGDISRNPQWSVQVEMVNPGDAGISASFQMAIYESLLEELSKTKKFKHVYRDGERISSGASDLLIMKTKVEHYTAGNETQRAVTTVSGATKLTVTSQLCTPGGSVVFERTVHGNVRFMGSNLRATHNLARNVAKTTKQSTLPAPSMSASL